MIKLAAMQKKLKLDKMANLPKSLEDQIGQKHQSGQKDQNGQSGQS